MFAGLMPARHAAKQQEQAKLTLFDVPKERKEAPPPPVPIQRQADRQSQSAAPRAGATPRAIAPTPAKPAPAPTANIQAMRLSVPTGALRPAEPPPPPAPPAPPKSDRAALRADYAATLWAHIRIYRPRGVHIPGTARIAFTVRADGTLDDVTLALSSGSAMLDRLALRTVRRASPAPRPPAQLAADASFTLDFKFD
ncbi:energy transducer TonB family protein [Stakelama pacifica]|uniref:energy transducer TonB family protein n=1 Tax=Stakelama pacifica TaxID=517720 RepID=UPI001E3EC8E4|nr:energy transducer TonB [Stakelama pacifica]